jgi:hypothetical protein
MGDDLIDDFYDEDIRQLAARAVELFEEAAQSIGAGFES